MTDAIGFLTADVAFDHCLRRALGRMPRGHRGRFVLEAPGPARCSSIWLAGNRKWTR